MPTCPPDGLRRPAAALSGVDFPHPVGPTIETNSPGWTARSIAWTAVYRPPPLRPKAMATFRRATAGAAGEVWTMAVRASPAFRQALGRTLKPRLALARGGRRAEDPAFRAAGDA